jgi:hypothetical protein
VIDPVPASWSKPDIELQAQGKLSSADQSDNYGVSAVRTQDIALSMACAINQYKGTDLLELKILLEI